MGSVQKIDREKSENSVLPVFKKMEKCKLLEQVFFERTHLKQNNFDDKFFKEVNNECQNVKANLNTQVGRENLDSDIIYKKWRQLSKR